MPDQLRGIGKWVRPAVLDLSAYHVPPAAGLVKMDAMENPYQLPLELRQKWIDRLGRVEVNRYPDPGCGGLKKTIRAALNIEPQAGLLLGNGSDEIIQMIAMLVGGPGRTLMAPTPSFSMYRLISVTTGSSFREVPLNPDFSADGDALLSAIDESEPAAIFLAYPNNPTGNCFDQALILQVLERASGVVVLDEAYFTFCGRTFLPQLTRFENLVVMRTLSKSGMAGLRLGMLAGHPEWIEQLEKLRLPYNINSLTQCSANFYLEHQDVMQGQADMIVSQREQLSAQLTGISCVTPYPSESNFILFRVAGDASEIYNEIRRQGVLIKNLHQPGTLLENCLRVTVSTPEENQQFIAALNRSLS